MPLRREAPIQRLAPEWAALLKERRIELGLSVRLAAAMAGIAPSAWLYHERGHTLRVPDVELLRRMATTLNLPVQTLVDAAFGGHDALTTEYGPEE